MPRPAAAASATLAATLAAATLAALLVLGLAAPAAAQVDEAVAAFRDGNPVYVHPDADLKITERQADRLRKRINEGDRSIFVAILPQRALDEVGGDPNRLPAHVYDRLGFAGTYAVVAGNSFRAGSTELREGRAGDIATRAFREHRDDGVAAVLAAFVEGVQAAPAGAESPDAGGGGTTFLLLLLLAAAALVVVLAIRSRRARNALERKAESERQLVRADLGVLANDVIALEPVVTLHPDAADEYEEAVSRFRFASEAVDKVLEPDDFDRVRRVVAEAHYAIARAKAVIDGREPPPPPPELASPGKHDEPPVVIERGRPTYGGAESGWYGGGWFGGGAGGGLLTGILLGDALSGRHHRTGGAAASGGDFGGDDDVGGGDF